MSLHLDARRDPSLAGLFIPAPATDTTPPPRAAHNGATGARTIGGERVEMCDRCGPNVPAAWKFRHPNDPDRPLTMCGHCSTAHRKALRDNGWHTYHLVRVPASV